MRQAILLLLITIFLNSCGSNVDSSINKESKNNLELQKKFNVSYYNNEEEIIIKQESTSSIGFDYKTQREVSFIINDNGSDLSKQILFYETKELISTPVGDTELFKNLLYSTNFKSSEDLKFNLTLGNHIKDIWIVVPFYNNLTINIPILNNTIFLNIN